MSKLKGAIKYLAGHVFTKDGVQVESQQEAWRKEAKCGCGIDCCENELVLTDKSASTGVSLYFEGGELRIRLADGSVFRATLTAV